MCRKKKIKCDGSMPACKNCINYKTECIFTHVEKKRNPPKGYGQESTLIYSLANQLRSAKYIEGLENRLARMERLLRRSGLLEGDNGQEPDLGILEKRIADSSHAKSGSPDIVSKPIAHARVSRSPDSTPRTDGQSPSTSTKSPDTLKDDRDGAEELSEMMCTLVTNNAGDTRYVGSQLTLCDAI